MSGQEIKIHLYNRATNNVVCNHYKGNGSFIEIESFKKMLEDNKEGLCKQCIKYLKTPMGKRVK